MKILFLIPSLVGGGAEKVLVNLVNNLDKNKFDVTVQVLFAGGVNEQYLSRDINYKYCYKKIFRGNSHYFKLFSPKHLYKKFIKEHYDVIVSYLEGPTARIVSGCTDENTKLVSWIHCRMDTPQAGAVGFRNFEEAKECYNKFHYTACVSKWVKDYFVDTFNFQNPIGVVYNTIETKSISEKACEKITDYYFDKSIKTLVAVGTLKEVKGFDRLIRIHKKLIDHEINNRVILLGHGPDIDKLTNLTKELKVNDTFQFLGYNTNPYKYISSSDLYVCSSYSEGFSTSVTESLIVGTPVVTTLCSGMQEMLGENNEYGIVTENNEDALYEGIKTMLTTPGMLEDYAEKAKERGKYFDTESTTKAVEDMIERLFLSL